MTPLSFQDVTSDQAKRLKTRALLMDSAITEFAARGIDKTSVNDIISRAGVSHGTFYYHFANKDVMAEAVGRTVAAALVNIVDREIEDIERGIERVAIATQIFIRLSSTMPTWGRLVVHALTNMGAFQLQISRGIRKDVIIGIRQGDFVIVPSDILFESLLAVVGTAVRNRLEHPKFFHVEPEATVLLLRMLGVSSAAAQALPYDVIRKYGEHRLDMAVRARDVSQALLELLLKEISTDIKVEG